MDPLRSVIRYNDRAVSWLAGSYPTIIRPDIPCTPRPGGQRPIQTAIRAVLGTEGVVGHSDVRVGRLTGFGRVAQVQAVTSAIETVARHRPISVWTLLWVDAHCRGTQMRTATEDVVTDQHIVNIAR